MPRYEFVEGSSSKFWDIEMAGKAVTTTWGRIGTPGSSKSKTWPSPAAAQKEYDKLVREKTGKGYALVGGGKKAAKAAKAAPVAPPEPRDAGLEKAIREDPDDDGPYSVYGDWLVEQGHVRGELVVAQAHKNQAVAKKLLAKHPELWGGLAKKKELSNVVWRNGFIERVRIAAIPEWQDDDGDGDGDGDAKKKPKELDVPAIVGALLDGPGRFLRDLTVGIVVDFENTYTQVTAAIAKRGPHPTLRSIYFGDFTSEDTELNWSTIGDLSKLYAAVPNLTDLKLRSGDMKLGAMNLPNLRRLTIYTGGLKSAAAASIADARWPKLEKLDVMFGPKMEGALASVKPLANLLAAKAVPNLRWLGLKNFEFGKQLVPALLASKVLRQLKVLDLSMGTLGDPDAAVLLAGKAQLAHLEELVVAENYFTKAGIKTLAGLGIKVTSKGNTRGGEADVNSIGQREPYEGDEDDPDARYAAVYE